LANHNGENSGVFNMIIYALYYYDRPLLKAFLNHYCQFKTIKEILIQDQNWSREDSLYLYRIVAEYIDKYNKKIVILPSLYKSFKGEKNKRKQFLHYGQPAIRNHVTQFLQKKVWIMGSMDGVIYGKDYKHTEKCFVSFEKLAQKRAKQGLTTAGFMRYYCVYYDGFFPVMGMPMNRIPNPTWRARIFRFTTPFKCRGRMIHDNSFDAYINKKWKRILPVAHSPARRWECGVALKQLRILHYHTLIRSSMDSARFTPVKKKKIKEIEAHPKHYLNLL